MINSILGLVRHGLTFAGGYLVSSGLLDAAGLENAVGAAITLLGIAWSIYDKIKSGRA